MHRMRWIVLIAISACSEAPVDPRHEGVALSSERWGNGRTRAEYQYYLNARGQVVRHGWYREYSRFVDRLVAVEEHYDRGVRVGPRRVRCEADSFPLDYDNGDFEFGTFDGWSLERAREESIALVADAGRGRYDRNRAIRPAPVSHRGSGASGRIDEAGAERCAEATGR